PARNAASDATDIVFYNPSALTMLKDGWHINLSNQTLFRSPSHSYDLGFGEGTKTYAQNASDPFLPNLYAAYKKNNWALYTGVFNPGGGATLDYPHGSITTDLIGLGVLDAAGGAYTMIENPSLKASSMYLTTTFGGSYAFSKMVSATMAVRYINAKNTVQSSMTMAGSPIDLPNQELNLDADYTASGWGGVVGINVAPNDKTNFSLRYESQVNLDFKTKTNKDDFGLMADGTTSPRDLPAVLAIGFAHQTSSKVKLFGDVNYYLQENADWGTSTTWVNTKPLAKRAGNAIMYSLACEYAVSQLVSLSVGGSFTDYSFKDMNGYYTNIGTFEVVQEDNYTLNTGFVYHASDKIALNVGYMHVFYPTDQKLKALMAQPLDVDVTVNNSANVIAIGVDWTF
ncbi:MAG: outer membrane protein transport protein, partial [Bacteroidia bacterium]|nr:outer membrane protein transport protein [Bacteroidia bacterium]